MPKKLPPMSEGGESIELSHVPPSRTLAPLRPIPKSVSWSEDEDDANDKDAVEETNKRTIDKEEDSDSSNSSNEADDAIRALPPSSSSSRPSGLAGGRRFSRRESTISNRPSLTKQSSRYVK